MRPYDVFIERFESSVDHLAHNVISKHVTMVRTKRHQNEAARSYQWHMRVRDVSVHVFNTRKVSEIFLTVDHVFEELNGHELRGGVHHEPSHRVRRRVRQLNGHAEHAARRAKRHQVPKALQRPERPVQALGLDPDRIVGCFLLRMSLGPKNLMVKNQTNATNLGILSEKRKRKQCLDCKKKSYSRHARCVGLSSARRTLHTHPG